MADSIDDYWACEDLYDELIEVIKKSNANHKYREALLEAIAKVAPQID